jgi:hypothetical protein
MWYHHEATLNVLNERNVVEPMFAMIWEQVPLIKHDFEVKRFILGLGKLVTPQPLPAFMQAKMQ